MKRNKKNKLGFTLFELLVVLGLVGILLLVTAVFAPIQAQKARDAVRKLNLDSMKKAIDEYYQDSNCYPQTIPTCQNPLILGDLVVKDDLPCDPKTKLSYTYVPEVAECPSWFQLYVNLENERDTIIDRVGCRYGCGPSCQFNYGVASTNQDLNPYCSEFVPATPAASPEPTVEPTPVPPAPLQYVCAPGQSSCEVYANPELSGCPDVYLNDPTCQGACTEKINRCHDARGKFH